MRPDEFESGHAVAKGISLLFASGKRPDSGAIAEFAARSPEVSLTHVPADNHHSDEGESFGGRRWVELLRSGLTFDLAGLAPGQPMPTPETEYGFDFPDREALLSCEALQLLHGPHLVGGERSPPVVRGLLALARDLVHHFEHLQAVAWPQSRSVIGRRLLDEQRRVMLNRKDPLGHGYDFAELDAMAEVLWNAS